MRGFRARRGALLSSAARQVLEARLTAPPTASSPRGCFSNASPWSSSLAGPRSWCTATTTTSTQDEIAELTGLSRKTVGKRSAEIRQALEALSGGRP
ncbi:MAG: hypothetical protein R3F59_07935 [Myxococcota bacterium]